MTEGLGPMVRSNGSQGGQQVYINVWREGQEPQNNRSLYHIIVEFRGNGNGGWNVQGNDWSASSGNLSWAGSFGIHYGEGGNTFRLLDTTFWRYHDANGNDQQFNSRADIVSTNREYIGSGSVTITEPPIPAFSKKPSPPGTPTFSKVGPNQVTVSWTASTDNGRSPIDGYLLRYWPNAEGSGPYTDHSVQNNLTRTITGLKEGLTYRFVVYAHNGSADNNGFSLPSNANKVLTFWGLRIRVAGKWKMALVYVKVNGKWKLARPFIRVNKKWKKAG